MQDKLKKLIGDNINFVFVGEAGSGKSEISINFAKWLVQLQDKPVHFFDMDMTKPLFRSRDVEMQMEALGIICHHCYVVMDVGGDHIGARAIGGYAPKLNKDNTIVYYVLNAYRPWSNDIDHIDGTLGQILGVSHIQLGKLHMVNNPNNGITTTAKEFIEGSRKMSEMVTPYIAVDFACVREDLYEDVKDSSDVPVFPIELFLTYPWLQTDFADGQPVPGRG